MALNKGGSKSKTEAGFSKDLRRRAGEFGFDILGDDALATIGGDRVERLFRPLDLSPIGLQAPTQRLFDTTLNQAINQSFNKASASAAQRGQVTPFNLGNIAADAGRRTTAQLTPLFAPIAESNALFNAQQPLNSVLAQFNALSELIRLAQGFGQGSTSRGSQSNFGFNTGARINLGSLT